MRWKNALDEINDYLEREEEMNKLEDKATEMLQTETLGKKKKSQQNISDNQWIKWPNGHALIILEEEEWQGEVE